MPAVIPPPNLNLQAKTVELFGAHPRGGIVCIPVQWLQLKWLAAQVISLECKAEENAAARANGLPAPHTMPDGWPEDADGTAAPSKIIRPTLIPPSDLARRTH